MTLNIFLIIFLPPCSSKDSKKITLFHHLEMEIGMILRHKLGKTYPPFQTNWFDNIWHPAELLFHLNCSEKYWKIFYSLWLLMNKFFAQQFPLLKEEEFFLTILLKLIDNQAKNRASKAIWKMQVIVIVLFWINFWAEQEDL